MMYNAHIPRPVSIKLPKSLITVPEHPWGDHSDCPSPGAQHCPLVGFACAIHLHLDGHCYQRLRALSERCCPRQKQVPGDDQNQR